MVYEIALGREVIEGIVKEELPANPGPPGKFYPFMWARSSWARRLPTPPRASSRPRTATSSRARRTGERAGEELPSGVRREAGEERGEEEEIAASAGLAIIF